VKPQNLTRFCVGFRSYTLRSLFCFIWMPGQNLVILQSYTRNPSLHGRPYDLSLMGFSRETQNYGAQIITSRDSPKGPMKARVWRHIQACWRNCNYKHCLFKNHVNAALNYFVLGNACVDVTRSLQIGQPTVLM